ncbi:MAG TPA: lysyl oxidase family protein [Candidatus Paceibacterota bacterium]
MKSNTIRWIILFILILIITASTYYAFLFKSLGEIKEDVSDSEQADIETDELNKAVQNIFYTNTDLLPDLIPLPPDDVQIINENDNVFLLFTTMFYNRGKGPLELRVDEEAARIKTDVDQDVIQRIYKEDGTFRERLSGKFLWHQTHLHYHFSDFVIYDLEPVGAPDDPSLSGVRSKATFCIRDVSSVDLDLKDRLPEGKYLICGKKLQGISIGWADTYFSNYPDQRLNLTGLASGTYRLNFIVNPEDSFEEETLNNNISSALLYIDMQNETVEILETNPINYPKVEHIYIEQSFE